MNDENILWMIFLGLVTSFVWEEIAGLLNLVCRSIVRSQASKMGARAERAQEEWLAQLADTRGVAHQLLFAFGTFFIATNTRLEADGKLSGNRWRFADSWVRRNASWFAVIPAVWLFVKYPPEPVRYAAYSIWGSVLLLWVFWFAAPLRRVVGSVYEKLNYAFRVGAGGVVVPSVVGLAVVASLILPTWQPPQKVQLGANDVEKPFKVIYVSAEVLEVERAKTKSDEVSTRVDADGVELPPGVEVTSTTADGSAGQPSLIGVKQLRIFELPTVVLPEQPIPIEAEVALLPPGPPLSLRITSGQ